MATCQVLSGVLVGLIGIPCAGEAWLSKFCACSHWATARLVAQPVLRSPPGRPVARSFGLLCLHNELLWAEWPIVYATWLSRQCFIEVAL